MRKTSVSILLAVVLAVLLLTPDPAESGWGWRKRRGWFKKAMKNTWNFAKPIVQQVATNYLLKLAGTAALAGRREAGVSECGVGEELVTQAVRELQDACSKMPASLKTQGVTLNQLVKVFKEKDANNDKALTGDELKEFTLAIETYEDCAAL